MFLLALLLKLVAFAQFIFFYQEGGQGHKWMKSWLAPGVLAGMLLLIELVDHKFGIFSAIGALLYLAASNGFSYGVKLTKDKPALKIVFRGLCGASYGLCGLLIGIGTGHWLIGGLQLLIATLGSILLGTLNPFPSSWGNAATRLEDFVISSSYVALLGFIV